MNLIHRPPRSGALNTARARANGWMLWALGAVAFAAPLAYGSNLPVYWLIWTVAAGVLGAPWFSWLAWQDAQPRLGPALYKGLIAGFAAFALYHVVQIVPLGSLAPAARSVADPQTPILLHRISLLPGETFLALLRWLTGGVIFFLALQVAATQERARLFLQVIFWTIVLHAVVALIMRFQLGDTLFGIPKWAYLGSTTGGFVNRNSFATYLAFGCVIGAVRILELALERPASTSTRHAIDFYTDRNGITPVILGWIVLLVTLVSTNSRMGFFAALCCMVFALALLLLRSVPEKGGRRRVWKLPLAAFTVIILTAMLYGARLYERTENLYLGYDLKVRLDLFRQVWDMTLDRPFTGFGGSAFEIAYPLYHQLPVSFAYVWDKTHSTYLALWVEYGLVFGSIPILMFAWIFLKLILDCLRTPKIDAAILTAAAVLLVGALHSLVDFSLEMQGVSVVYTMVAAIGFARVLERSRKQKGTMA